MKKQILVLLLALFAIGITSVNAQLTPRALECIDLTNPLIPVPGRPYTYEVNVPTPPGAKSYLWFVTQDINFITAGALTSNRTTIGGPLLAAGSGHYNTSTLNANTISLTWQSFVLNPNEYVFVVIQVVNDNGTCDTKNLKVYRIQPIHAFSLDIANVLPTGVILGADYGANINHCISDIQTAVYDPVNNEVDYNFGSNTMHYAVVAANYSGQWQLRVQLGGLQAGQTATIYWGTTFNSQEYTIATNATNGTFTATNLVSQSNSIVGPTGELIYIKMVITHGTQFEGVGGADFPIALAVNGNLHNGTAIVPNYADIHHVGTPCAQVDFDDLATQTLTRRPEINSVSPPPPGFLPIGN